LNTKSRVRQSLGHYPLDLQGFFFLSHTLLDQTRSTVSNAREKYR
jgi:hypothetical protein